MYPTHENLRNLFSLCRDAVIGVSNDVVVFSNAAAAALFNKNVDGTRVCELLPENLISPESDKLYCSTIINNRSVSMTMNRVDGLALFCVSAMPDEDNNRVGNYVPLIASLNSSLHSLKSAADMLIGSSEGSMQGSMGSVSAIMMRSYFSALRAVKNFSLLNQLSDGSIPFEPQMTDLAEFFSDLVGSVRLLSSKMGMDISFKTSGSDFTACIDQDLAEQMVLCIISNSLLHMQKTDCLSVSLHEDPERIIIAFDDNGSGMDDTTLSTLFAEHSGEGLRSGRETDTGFGLAIVRGIVIKHGGSIILESRAEEGCSVRVMLPRNISQGTRFRSARARYASKNMDVILRELSGFLDADFFRQLYLD